MNVNRQQYQLVLSALLSVIVVLIGRFAHVDRKIPHLGAWSMRHLNFTSGEAHYRYFYKHSQTNTQNTHARIKYYNIKVLSAQ